MRLSLASNFNYDGIRTVEIAIAIGIGVESPAFFVDSDSDLHTDSATNI